MSDNEIKDPRVDPVDVLRATDYVSQKYVELVKMIIEHGGDEHEKLKKIASARSKMDHLLSYEKIRNLISSAFFIDGAIKITKEDMHELSSHVFSVVGENESMQEDAASFLAELEESFCYVRAGNLIFRGPKYYFLFDSLALKNIGPMISVNDYEIAEFDAEGFVHDYVDHYRDIDRFLRAFADYILASAWKSFQCEHASLNEKVQLLLSEDVFNVINEKIDSGKYSVGDPNIDCLFQAQWRECIDRLRHFRTLTAEAKDAPGRFYHWVLFLGRLAPMFRNSKVTFGIDVDSVINPYMAFERTSSMRKLILGFLDAKINMLAFGQNLAQILFSEQFLSTEHAGELIFNSDVTKNIKKLCPESFALFKSRQQELRDRHGDGELLAEIDDYVTLYVDVMLDDNPASYLRLIGELPLDDSDEKFEGRFPRALKGALELLVDLYRLLSEYEVASEGARRRRAGKAGDDASLSGPTLASACRVKATRKLIRLYREENDPIVMMRTAQNALNKILNKGFQPNVDVLHVMSVNYGGALVGAFAKQVFAKTVNNGQVLMNAGSLIYSIYDVKNANNFSKLVDYPYSRILHESERNPAVKDILRGANWLLVFDDNTNSGETLDNLRKLAEASGHYGRIDVFACRASMNLMKYRSSLSSKDKLEIIGYSAMENRRVRRSRTKRRYQELIGTIVGNNLWKVFRQQNRPSAAA